MTPISYTLTHADWVAGQRAHFVKTLFKTTAWTAALTLLVGFLSTSFLDTTTPDNLLRHSLIIAGCCFAYFTAIRIFTALIGFNRYAKTAFVMDPSLGAITDISWDAEFLQFVSQNSSSRYRPSDLSGVHEASAVILLYKGYNFFIMVPTRIFETDALRSEFVGFLAKNSHEPN